MERGKYQEALTLNNKVLELDDKLPLAYNNRGFVKYKLNDLEGAMADIKKSLELYPSNSYAYKNRGLVLLAMGEHQKACEDFRRAIMLGYTMMYGDEVEKLKDLYCSN